MTLTSNLELLLLPRRLVMSRSKRVLRLISSYLFFVLGNNLHWQHLLALDVVLNIILILLDGILSFVVLIDTTFCCVVTVGHWSHLLHLLLLNNLVFEKLLLLLIRIVVIVQLLRQEVILLKPRSELVFLRSYFLYGHLQMMTVLLLVGLFPHGLLGILIWISGLLAIRFWTRISRNIWRALGVLRLVIWSIVLWRVEILLLLIFFLVRTLEFCPGMLRVLLWIYRLILRLISIRFVTRLNTIWDRICSRTFLWLIGEMTLASGNHILVMTLPMSQIYLLLMTLNRRSYYLLIVIIIDWSFNIGDCLHGVLVVVYGGIL